MSGVARRAGAGRPGQRRPARLKIPETPACLGLGAPYSGGPGGGGACPGGGGNYSGGPGVGGAGAA